jgi:phage terminase Nu1 subunit (DNA packaging protein)
MSITINTNFSAANTYAATTSDTKPTLQELQSKVQNAQNVDTFEVMGMIPIHDNSHQISDKYQQWFEYTFNIDEVISLYQRGRNDIQNAYAQNDMLEAHLAMFDKAFENQMGRIADKIAGDLWMEQHNRKMEAIYIPKYIRQLEQWRDEAIKNGRANTANVFSAEIERMNGRLGIKDNHHKLAANNGFDSDEFAKNSAYLMREYAQKITQEIKSGLDFSTAQKSAFEYMLETFNKTKSLNELSFNDFLVVYNHSDYVAFMTDKPTAITDSMRNDMYRNFNNSTELSAELKALLNWSHT